MFYVGLHEFMYTITIRIWQVTVYMQYSIYKTNPIGLLYKSKINLNIILNNIDYTS